MIEERNFKLDEIKKIRLNWDFEDVIFPRDVIKNFSYSYNHVKNDYFRDRLYLSELFLEVDLDYVLNGHCYYDNFEEREDKKNIDCLKYNCVWYMTITTTDDKEYDLEIPFYSKNFFLDERTNVHNAKNTFEKHEQKENSYIIRWNEDEESTRLTFEEMILLFKNKKKKGAPLTKNNFQIEVLNRLLKEKDEKRGVDFLSVFGTFLEDGEVYKIKSEFEIKTSYIDEKHYSIVILDLVSNFKKGQIRFIFIKDEVDESYDLAKNREENLDFSKTVYILSDRIDATEFNKKIGLTKSAESDMICTNLGEMNQIWYDMICSWGI